jgi:hypothetical protein
VLPISRLGLVRTPVFLCLLLKVLKYIRNEEELRKRDEFGRWNFFQSWSTIVDLEMEYGNWEVI